MNNNETNPLISKYQAFVGNLEWHLKNNPDEDWEITTLRLDIYKEILSDLQQSQSLPAEPKLSDKIGHINCDREALKDPEFVNAINHMAELAYHKVNPKKEVCSCGYPNSSAGYNTNWKMVCSSCGNPKSESFQSLPAVEQPEKSVIDLVQKALDILSNNRPTTPGLGGPIALLRDAIERLTQQPSQPEGKKDPLLQKLCSEISEADKKEIDEKFEIEQPEKSLQKHLITSVIEADEKDGLYEEQPEGETLEEEIKDKAEAYAGMMLWINKHNKDPHQFHEYIAEKSYIAGATEYANQPHKEWSSVLEEFVKSCYIGCSITKLDELRIRAEKLLNVKKNDILGPPQK